MIRTVVLVVLLVFIYWGFGTYVYKSGQINKEATAASSQVVTSREGGEKQAFASWYGFESCTNPECLQANTKPMVEGDSGMACSSAFRLGDRIRISYNTIELVLTCTDRGNFEDLGRGFDIHKWSFEKLAPLSRGVIKINYEVI